MVGLNPVTLWSPSGSTVTIQTGEKRDVSPGDHIDIVKDDLQLRFVLTEGAMPGTVGEVQSWLHTKLPENVWRVASQACEDEGIDGLVLGTMTDAEMQQVLGIERFGDRRRLQLALQQFSRQAPRKALLVINKRRPGGGGSKCPSDCTVDLTFFDLSNSTLYDFLTEEHLPMVASVSNVMASNTQHAWKQIVERQYPGLARSVGFRPVKKKKGTKKKLATQMKRSAMVSDWLTECAVHC